MPSVAWSKMGKHSLPILLFTLSPPY